MIVRTFLALLAVLFAAQAHARAPTPEDRAALAQKTQALGDALAASDISAMIDGIPPRMLALMAQKAGVSEDKVRVAAADAARQAMTQVKFVSYTMDLDAARFGEGKDGSPYALVPTVTVMAIADAQYEARSDTLAVHLEDGWRLVRLQGASQIAIFREAYPQFADVDIPQGTMRPLSEK